MIHIDYDPMNGIVKYLRTNNKFGLISATESSYKTSYMPDLYLLQHENSSSFWLNYNEIVEYFEIHFFNETFVSLTG